MSKQAEFKAYFDTCIQSAARTRNSIYLLVAVLVSCFTIYFNTQGLNFAAARMEKMELAYNCIKHTNLSIPELEALPTTDACREPLLWSSRMNLPTTYDRPGTPVESRWERHEVINLYREHLNTFVRKRADLRSIQVPLFGSVLDLEDLGILAGIAFVILAFVIRANMHREYDALEAAIAKVQRSHLYEIDTSHPNTPDEKMELLGMVQVLASPKHDNRGLRWAVPVIFWAAPVLHYAIWKNDRINPLNVNFLMGPDNTTYLVVSEALLLAVLIVVTFLNTLKWISMLGILSEENVAAIRKKQSINGGVEPLNNATTVGHTPPVKETSQEPVITTADKHPVRTHTPREALPARKPPPTGIAKGNWSAPRNLIQ